MACGPGGPVQGERGGQVRKASMHPFPWLRSQGAAEAAKLGVGQWQRAPTGPQIGVGLASDERMPPRLAAERFALAPVGSGQAGLVLSSHAEHAASGCAPALR